MMQENKNRRGWKTSEFWVTIGTALSGILVAAGVLNPEAATATSQAVGSVAAAIAAVGYAWSRAKSKS